ncbi:hypothetical protein I532_19621, partial [Brevibacillus borstelensis AK1]
MKVFLPRFLSQESAFTSDILSYLLRVGTGKALLEHCLGSAESCRGSLLGEAASEASLGRIRLHERYLVLLAADWCLQSPVGTLLGLRRILLAG